MLVSCYRHKKADTQADQVSKSAIYSARRQLQQINAFSSPYDLSCNTAGQHKPSHSRHMSPHTP